jgi:hypothetical protein
MKKHDCVDGIHRNQFSLKRRIGMIGMIGILGAITPLGFTACCPANNPNSGTEQRNNTPSTLTTEDIIKITSTSTVVVTDNNSPTCTVNYSNIVIDQVALIYHEYHREPSGPWYDPINHTAYLDLDTMEIGNTPQADLQFFTIIASTEWISLVPQNGAKLGFKGKEEITLSDCYMDPTFGEQKYSNAFKGNHLCALSNNDKIFLLVVEDILDEPDPITLSPIYTLKLLITSMAE